jgi:tryptophan halogenase
VGEAAIPPIRNFNHMLGIDEAEFIVATQGTFKLGIEFHGWGRPNESYMHPFGYTGGKINGLSFHPFWIKARRAGRAGEWGDYGLNTLAARADRFAWPDPNPASPLSALSYAYHFDAALYAGFLRRIAEARGVERIEATVEAVKQDPRDGTLTGLGLADGREIEGDFFFDCTGFRALLIGETLKVPYMDWSHHLPVNRAVAVPSERMSAPMPYTQAIARPAGWRWRIPLQHRTGNGYVYAADHLADDAAADHLLQNLDGRALAEPRFLRFTSGRRERTWVGNCLAVGLAGGFLEPLESTSIHLIQNALTRFATVFPTRRNDDLSSSHYNRLMTQEVENIRDFLIFHYHVNERVGEPLWDALRYMRVPDSLTEKIELFKARGLTQFPGQTVFQEENWMAVMLGQGLVPQTHDPLIDALPDDALYSTLDAIRRDCLSAVERMPMHDAVLRQIQASNPSSRKF